jgi:hypothetical protein
MGMAVKTGRLAVSGPSGVCNAGMGVKDFGHVWLVRSNELLQLGNLANLLESVNFIFLVTVNSKTGRIISTVFQACKAIHECVENKLAVFLDQVIDVPEDSTV